MSSSYGTQEILLNMHLLRIEEIHAIRNWQRFLGVYEHFLFTGRNYKQHQTIKNNLFFIILKSLSFLCFNINANIQHNNQTTICTFRVWFFLIILLAMIWKQWWSWLLLQKIFCRSLYACMTTMQCLNQQGFVIVFEIEYWHYWSNKMQQSKEIKQQLWHSS